jgi:hypothetical protein
MLLYTEISKWELVERRDLFLRYKSTFHVIIRILCYFIIRLVCDYRIDGEINIRGIYGVLTMVNIWWVDLKVALNKVNLFCQLKRFCLTLLWVNLIDFFLFYVTF